MSFWKYSMILLLTASPFLRAAFYFPQHIVWALSNKLSIAASGKFHSCTLCCRICIYWYIHSSNDTIIHFKYWCKIAQFFVGLSGSIGHSILSGTAPVQMKVIDQSLKSPQTNSHMSELGCGRFWVFFIIIGTEITVRHCSPVRILAFTGHLRGCDFRQSIYILHVAFLVRRRRSVWVILWHKLSSVQVIFCLFLTFRAVDEEDT